MGPGFFLLPGPRPGRDRNFFIAEAEIFFIAGAGPGFKFFYCWGRGWAGIKNVEMTGAGPGLEN